MIRPILAAALVVLVQGPRASRGPDIFFAATPQRIVTALLELARVLADDVVYHLGSGDGRIVTLAAQRFGARGRGIEIDPRLVALSRQLAHEAGVDNNVTFIEADLYETDLSNATVV